MPENLDDCICTLIERFGSRYKSQLSGLLSSLIGILTGVRAVLTLYLNPEDYVRQTALEFEKDIAYAVISEIEAPFTLVLGYTKGLSDCSPVNTFSKSLKQVKDLVINPVKEIQYEIEQYVAALEDKNRQVEKNCHCINEAVLKSFFT